MVLCGYSDLLQKEVSLIKTERASQIHGYKSVCKAISSHYLEDIRKTTAAASSVRQRTMFTPHSQTLILSLGSLLKSNQKGLSYSITCIHQYTREHITLGQDSTQELQLGNFVAGFSPSLACMVCGPPQLLTKNSERGSPPLAYGHLVTYCFQEQLSPLRQEASIQTLIFLHILVFNQFTKLQLSVCNFFLHHQFWQTFYLPVLSLSPNPALNLQEKEIESHRTNFSIKM